MGGLALPVARCRSHRLWLRWVLQCAALLIGAAAALPGPSAARTAAGGEGPVAAPYLWGGLLAEGEGIARFHRSTAFLLDRGFTALRFTVSPRAVETLGLSDSRCRRDQGIACYLQLALAGPAFDRPELRLLMLTLHEFAARDAVAGGLAPRARDAAMTEFGAALDVLERRFAGRRIRVVVSNWEGDNMVYCGSVFRYVRQPAFAERCDTPSGDGIERRLGHFVQWIEARDAMVAAFRSKHPTLDLEHAPEFNIAYLGPGNCTTRCDMRRTVFEALTRNARRPLCSYSAYNSTNRAALGQDLDRLLQGCERVIIGELGFDAARGGKERARLSLDLAAQAVARFPGRIPAVVIWNAFNKPARQSEGSFGLFDPDGAPALLEVLPSLFSPQPGK